jgi:di/tricarboxylate transporter
MNTDMIIVLAVIVLAVFLFATEKIRVDLTAVIVMGILLLSGIITPEEGVSGFSNTATVTVAAMFIVSAALQKTGAVNSLGMLTSRIFKQSYWLGIIGTMLVVGVSSAFINNTPVVAVFIPILLTVSMDNSISASRLLMPVSFASMFGGLCTLIGTSTNILVSAIAVEHGLEPFGMFEFSIGGAILFVAGMVYMVVVGIRLIPDRKLDQDLTQRYSMNDYLIDVVLLPTAQSVGHHVTDSPLIRELEIDVLEVLRDGSRLKRPLPSIMLEAGDVLRVRCDVATIRELKDRVGVVLKAEHTLREDDFDEEDLLLVEAIIAPNSMLEGRTIKGVRFRNTFQANALALRHRGALLRKGFSETRLKAGDALLIQVRKENYDTLRRDSNFVIVSDIELPTYRKRKIIPALLIILGIILTATFNVFPIMVSAIAGVVTLIATGCITLEEAYDAVDWKVIFLLGGIISLGVALEKTGAALLLSDTMISLLGDFGPVAIVAALFFITSLLTGIMSNNATAVLLAPIAIAAAASMGVNPRPFLVAVTFAASSSFITPVGYQTNTMIYGVGQYRFADFLKVGTPLNLIFWILATLLIPLLFPF